MIHTCNITTWLQFDTVFVWREYTSVCITVNPTVDNVTYKEPFRIHPWIFSVNNKKNNMTVHMFLSVNNNMKKEHHHITYSTPLFCIKRYTTFPMIYDYCCEQSHKQHQNFCNVCILFLVSYPVIHKPLYKSRYLRWYSYLSCSVYVYACRVQTNTNPENVCIASNLAYTSMYLYILFL